MQFEEYGCRLQQKSHYEAVRTERLNSDKTLKFKHKIKRQNGAKMRQM